MSVHTPGPWELSWSDNAKLHYIDAGLSQMQIRPTSEYLQGHREELDANARLIAAAPELLEALTVAREWMRGDKWRNSTVEKHASWEAVMRGIDAAIANAGSAS